MDEEEEMLKYFGFLFNHFDVIIKSSTGKQHANKIEKLKRERERERFKKYLLMVVYDLIV